MKPTRQIAALAMILAVAACGNAPQQPSDVVDDKSSETSGFGVDNPVVSDSEQFESETGSTVDPVETASLPAQPADMSPVSGRWGSDQGACTDGNGVVTISATRFESPERICEIASTVDGGDDSITATLACPETGGEIEGDLLKLLPNADTLQLSYVGRSESPQTLVRCP